MNDHEKKTAFSSKSGEWRTPRALFTRLNKLYGPFALDAAATKRNALCSRFYTKEDNALVQQWRGRVFLNPPYGRGVGEWVAKAHLESQQSYNVGVACLLAARTDTAWWHDYVMQAAEVLFIRGRLRFSGHTDAAPFPSVVVLFSEKTLADNENVLRIFTMTKDGTITSG